MRLIAWMMAMSTLLALVCVLDDAKPKPKPRPKPQPRSETVLTGEDFRWAKLRLWMVLEDVKKLPEEARR